MSNFVIENDVPLPEIRRKRQEWPWPNMEVGQSVLVQDDKAGASISSAAAYGKKNNKRFSSRKNGEGIRIWRIE